MNRTYLLPLLVAGALAAAPVHANDPSLDGKTFAGSLWMQGEKHPDPDQFVFKDGTFRSTACDRYGFTAATYSATRDGDATVIEAQTTSPSDGTMTWRGTIRAGQFEGVSRWQPKRGGPVEGWFRANSGS
jgi:hypothetical protein